MNTGVSQPAPFPSSLNVALEGRQELASQGMSINDWAAMGRKEYEVVPHVAATAQVTNFHQTWNSLYPKPRPNPCERYHKTSCVAVTHTLCSVIVMASWFRENGSWDLHAQHTVMWWRGVVLMSRRATFAISNPCHYICSKKSVRCLLSLREQDNNLLSKVLKRKLLRYLFYSLVHKPRFFTSYKLKFQRFSQGKI